MQFKTGSWAVLGLVAGIVATAQAIEITVSIENVSPENGPYLTPVWVGFHNGRFDLFESGQPVSEEIERLAEDGTTGPLSAEFARSIHGVVDATIGSNSDGGPLAPGASATMTFELEGDFRQYRFLSYASMVVPSNDAFIANEDWRAIRLFATGGDFIGASFVVRGWEVRDAGTELNDEEPENTALFGQSQPDTGQDENVVVHDHVGLKLPGSGGIVDEPDFQNANIIGTGAPLARIKVTATMGFGEGDGLPLLGGFTEAGDDLPLVGGIGQIDDSIPLIGGLAPSGD